MRVHVSHGPSQRGPTYSLSLPFTLTLTHTHTHTYTFTPYFPKRRGVIYKAMETHLKERETDTHMWMRHMHTEDFGWYGFLETHSVAQFVVECCSVLQCVAVCCSVSQCVAVCCSVSQYDARISRTAGGRSWGFFETRQFVWKSVRWLARLFCVSCKCVCLSLFHMCVSRPHVCVSCHLDTCRIHVYTIHVHIYPHTYTYAHTFTYTCSYTYTYTYTYAYIHIHMCHMHVSRFQEEETHAFVRRAVWND